MKVGRRNREANTAVGRCSLSGTYIQTYIVATSHLSINIVANNTWSNPVVTYQNMIHMNHCTASSDSNHFIRVSYSFILGVIFSFRLALFSEVIRTPVKQCEASPPYKAQPWNKK